MMTVHSKGNRLLVIMITVHSKENRISSLARADVMISSTATEAINVKKKMRLG